MIETRKLDNPICPRVNVRYLYQPGEYEGGKSRATDPKWSVDIHKTDYYIIAQGIRVYYLKSSQHQREVLLKKNYFILPDNTVTKI